MIFSITGGRYTSPSTSLGRTRQILIPSEHQLTRLYSLLLTHSAIEVHDGDAIGTDRYVRSWIKSNMPWIKAQKWPVDGRVDGAWPQAGHVRSRRMLIRSKSKGLAAFPGGNGTDGCVQTALELRLRVWRWEGERDEGDFKEISR